MTIRLHDSVFTRSRRWVIALVALIIVGFGLADGLLAQSMWPPYPSSGTAHDIVRGSGGYFSWVKLLLLLAVFILWVRFADWTNRDALRFQEYTNLPAMVWNPIIVFTFLAGFLAAITIPLFYIGFPVYLIAAFLPYILYRLQRKGRIPDEAFSGKLFAEDVGQVDVPIEFKAAGKDDEQSQSNLIRARQSPVFEQTCQLLHTFTIRRGEQFLLDFSREKVAAKMQVDGIWHNMPTLDRETGDSILVSLKYLANLNPSERRQQQRGEFQAKVGRDKVAYDLTSQGVPTGERVLIKLLRADTMSYDLKNLGMPAEMVPQLAKFLNGPGFLIISSPHGQGLTATWQAVLNEADRFTRDFVAIVDYDDKETARENVLPIVFDSRKGETPFALLKKNLLKEPQALVVPNPVDAKTLDLLTDQVNRHNRTLISRIHANSACEALLRLMALSEDREQFVRAVSAISNQRLVRRLCPTCRKAVQANPKTIAQMGGDPQIHKALYVPYQLPPPEQRVDAQGKPIEMLPCETCSGIGYLGRMAIYELVVVNDKLRQALNKSPKLDNITKVARQQGNLTLLQQGYRAVLAGNTSLAEIQRSTQTGQQAVSKTSPRPASN